jgi:predicted MPP superfamily phosphohydrolase
MSGWRLLPIFITVTLLLLFIVQYYFFISITHFLKSTRKKRWLLYSTYFTFGIFNIPLIIILLFRPHFHILSNWLLYIVIYPFYIWHFSLLLLFLVLMLLKIVQLPYLLGVWLIGKFKIEDKQKKSSSRQNNDTYDIHRRAILRKGLIVLAGSAFAGSSYGTLRRDKFEITHISIPIKNLPDNFHEFTIALISDIHSSIFMQKEKMQRYAAVVNSLEADLIAVPGDFVNSMVDEVYPFAEAFSELKAPHGIYGVLGNHDFYTRRVEVVAQQVESCGIKLLRNDRIMIEKGEQKLLLLGIDDTGSRTLANRWVENIIERTTLHAPTILLCHRPYYFQQFAQQQIDLTLSGHTHGGQIVLGKLDRDVIAPARMVSPYVAGLYTIESSNMYVSRGIGTVGIPIRLNCPPEVTKITLVKA